MEEGKPFAVQYTALMLVLCTMALGSLPINDSPELKARMSSTLKEEPAAMATSSIQLIRHGNVDKKVAKGLQGFLRLHRGCGELTVPVSLIHPVRVQQLANQLQRALWQKSIGAHDLSIRFVRRGIQVGRDPRFRLVTCDGI